MTEAEVNEIPTRRAWAPFVGAALALLTTGSLVIFALVAQRTSLDGFSNDRVAAVRPTSAPPAAITIPGGAAPSGTASDGGSSTGDDAAATGVASPDVPVAAPSFFELVTTPPSPQQRDTVAFASPSENTADGGGTLEGPNQRLAEERALFARGGGGEPSDGERVGEVAGSDPRHDRKHSHRSHDAKDKAKKSKKSKGHRSKAGSPGRGHAARSTASSASRPAPRPESSQGAHRSSGSSQSSQNARQSSGPPPHSNAGGKGKARGRGHGKH